MQFLPDTGGFLPLSSDFRPVAEWKKYASRIMMRLTDGG